ncbi:MAG: hypothetical protein ACE364_04230 [Chlorobiota bacterium]
MISLSIFFSSDKVYCGLFKRSLKGVKLLDLSTTLDPIDLDDIDSEVSTKATNQLNRCLNEFDEKIEELNIVIDNEHSFWTIIPGNESTKNSDLRNLLELEIKNNVESFNLDDFEFRIYPHGKKDEEDNDQLFVIYFRNEIINNCTKILELVGLLPKYIITSQLASQNTIEYNYPDSSHLFSLLINKEEEFCDVTVSNDKKTFYYDLLKYENDEKLIADIKNILEKLGFEGIQLGNLLLSGSKLTKEFIDKLNDVTNLEFGRINSFRLVRANVDKRMKEYCFRTAHLFAPVVGGVLSSYDSGKIFEF